MNPDHPTSVSKALRSAADALRAGSDSPRLDAEVLLGHATGRSRAWLYANPDSHLSAAESDLFATLIAERRTGKPVAHLVGEREFWSLPLEVTAHTLVPRPETELLVETALHFLPPSAALRVLDLGTGSGAIAIAIAGERAACDITATDCSAEALAVAARNAARHCPGRITFYSGDWFEALPADTPAFDIIVSNPPYIATAERPLTDPELEWEPAQALYSGADGLDAIRTIISAAGKRLNPGGRLLLEHGFAQHTSITKLLQNCDFESVESAVDLAGNPRVTHGKKKN